jgi:hypothetical protein
MSQMRNVVGAPKSQKYSSGDKKQTDELWGFTKICSDF